MLDKTVDFFQGSKYIKTSGFSTDINFEDLVAVYLKEKEYDRILVRQWKDQKEVKSHNITFEK